MVKSISQPSHQSSKHRTTANLNLHSASLSTTETSLPSQTTRHPAILPELSNTRKRRSIREQKAYLGIPFPDITRLPTIPYSSLPNTQVSLMPPIHDERSAVAAVDTVALPKLDLLSLVQPATVIDPITDQPTQPESNCIPLQPIQTKEVIKSQAISQPLIQNIQKVEARPITQPLTSSHNHERKNALLVQNPSIRQPGEWLRWWLLRPGRIEFLCWFVGTIFLVCLTALFIVVLVGNLT